MTLLASRTTPPRALIAAGGTGGHVYPALAVANHLIAKGWAIDWVGTARGIESRVIPAAGLRLHALAVSGLRGKHFLSRLAGIPRLIWALLQSLKLLWRIKPDVVLGMGGYAAGPAGLAAWTMGRPLVIHEQNAVAGTTNRWLAPLAKVLLCGFANAFPDRYQAREIGNPVRSDLLIAGEQTATKGPSSGQPVIFRLLVLGGSLGAAPLNRMMPATVQQIVTQIDGCALEIRQQCGSRNRAEAEALWVDIPHAKLMLLDFIDDMAEAYQWADLVIARAGALTVSELAVTGTPSILIPLPHAIDDHQTANARMLEQSGGAILIPQNEANEVSLSQAIAQLIKAPDTLSQMSRAARAVARPDATEKVVQVLEEVVYAG